MRPSLWAIAAALVIALGTALLAVPHALWRWWITPDVVEHLATANYWVHGEGFVDPVQWSYFRSSGVPFPSFALRAPMVSLLVALPFALGGSIATVTVLHAIWASLLGGALVLVASRFMRLRAAVAAGVLLAWSPAWIELARHIWTEVTALGAFLAVLATARGVLRDRAGALACAVATVAGWLCRPNLLGLYPAVLAAAAFEVGGRGAWRSPGVRSYALATPLLVLATYAAVLLATGEGPYARYAVMLEMLSKQDGFYYGKEFVGGVRFFLDQRAAILAQVTSISGEFVAALAGRSYHWMAWFLPAALPYALLARDGGSFERRVAAFSAVGFAVVAVATYTHFDPRRYPLLTAASGALCIAAMLDALGHRLERIARPPWLCRLCGFLSPLVALALAAGPLPASGTEALIAWLRYRREGTLEISNRRTEDEAMRALCPHVPPGALVAAADPWRFHLWCGNPAVKLPLDLALSEIRARYFREQTPVVVVADASPRYAWLAHAPEVYELLRAGPLVLYAVRDAPSRRAPVVPPLAHLGR